MPSCRWSSTRAWIPKWTGPRQKGFWPENGFERTLFLLIEEEAWSDLAILLADINRIITWHRTSELRAETIDQAVKILAKKKAVDLVFQPLLSKSTAEVFDQTWLAFCEAVRSLNESWLPGFLESV